jgi:hypothetical protein
LASTGEGTPNPVVALAPPAAVGVQGTPDSQTKAGESSSEVPIGESSIAKQDLKYEPFVKFEDGWAQTMEWFTLVAELSSTYRIQAMKQEVSIIVVNLIWCRR